MKVTYSICLISFLFVLLSFSCKENETVEPQLTEDSFLGSWKKYKVSTYTLEPNSFDTLDKLELEGFFQDTYVFGRDSILINETGKEREGTWVFKGPDSLSLQFFDGAIESYAIKDFKEHAGGYRPKSKSFKLYRREANSNGNGQKVILDSYIGLSQQM